MSSYSSSASSNNNSVLYYADLRKLTDAVTTVSRVEVNQRALIDKILARYASANAVYRELLQNSNDAGATSAEIQFTTASQEVTSGSSSKTPVALVVYRNNGLPFRPEDWDRLQKIAEGNPDVNKIGAFGVGAYTSLSEEPVIVSGDKCLLFTWQGDALYTKTAPNTNISEWTTFVLPSRDPYPLPDWTEFGEFLTAALTFTGELKHISVSVNGVEKLSIVKTVLQPPQLVQTPKPSSTSATSFLWNSMTGNTSSIVTQSPAGIFYLAKPDQSILDSVVRLTVTVDQETVARMDARYVQATAHTRISSDMARKMHRVTKKDPPPRVTVQIFLNENAPSATLVQSGAATKQALQIAQSFAPTIGKGRIFIGFRTSQTTGLAAHLAAPFVPTVEREAMDLQDPVLSKFNTELLEFSGILLRLTLEHTMRNVIDVLWQQNRHEREALDKKLLLAHEQQKKKKAPNNPVQLPEIVADDGDTELKAEEATSSHSSVMSFARFMAKGVKKKVVAAVKTATTLLEGDDTQHLLNPFDPRSLANEEQMAVTLMQSFCPEQSTPDPAVGTALALGFSRCMPDSAPPVLTRSGVVPGDRARLPYNGIEAFVSDNVIRSVVFSNAEEYHTVIARCRKLNFEDLINAVSCSVLEQEKAVTLVQWWTKFSKVDALPRSTSQIRGSRLKESIRYHPDDGSSNVIVSLSDSFFFVEKNSSFAKRDLPLPETVLAEQFQKAIGYSVLHDEAIQDTWFSPLPIEIWADYISQHSCMNDARPEDENMRIRVLTLLSQEYMRCYPNERHVFGGFCRSLLSDRRCIPFDSDQPVQFAAERPSELYLHSAELKAFEGVGSFHKVAASLQHAGVTDAFLIAMGVRKSVSIDFLFEHLDTLKWSQDPKSLVEYLRSTTLTRNDISKLASTKYLPAANDQSRSYAPSELYLPNQNLRIFPFITMLSWPTESDVSEKSENGSFLVKLGMKAMPPLSSILSYLSQENLSESVLFEGLDFLCDRLVPHGSYYEAYNAMTLSDKNNYRIIPCVVRNPFSTGDPAPQRQSPVASFSDTKCSSMGYPVLDPKLGKRANLYASLFQCSPEPHTSSLLKQLAHLVEVAKKIEVSSIDGAASMSRIESSFSQIFEYLSHRSADLNYSAVSNLKRESFIPSLVDNKIVWYRPDEVFFKRENRANDALTEELFHVIEFSPFLAAAGVKEEATTKDLFQKMIESPNAVLQTLGSEKKYRSLLRRIAADPPFSLNRPPADVKKAAFLLAYTVVATEAKRDSDKATYHLAKAEDIYIIDNSNYGRMFPVNRAPPESDLEDFYAMLGSRYISKSVERRYEVVGSPVSNTPLTKAFRERIRERGPLLVSPNITSRPLVSGAAVLLADANLEFYETANLMAVYTLDKTARRNRVTCCSREKGSKRNALYMTEDLDMFDAGMAIGSMILQRCQLEDAFFISSLLEAPLDQLRARGFPVDRILQPEPAVVAIPPPERPTTAPVVAQNSIHSNGGNTAAALPPSSQTVTNNSMTTTKTEKTAPSDSKADILKQVYPDADEAFIDAALGQNPSIDDVRELAEKMSSGSYPKKGEIDNESTATSNTSSSGRGFDSTSNLQKKLPLRKRLGKAFGGKRGNNLDGGAQFPNMETNHGGPVGGGSSVKVGSQRHQTETRGPVSPAVDAQTQNSLENMLERSIGMSSEVQKNGIDAPETTLTSIPQELDRGESCEVIPGHSLKPFLGPYGNGKSHNGIQVFSSKQYDSSEVFLIENEISLHSFADVLERLGVNVFGLKLGSMAIYHDPAGVSIAFNSNRALHFNFRFFHALHFLQNKHLKSDCYAYWYMTICHELAHHFVSGHTREHGFYTESFSCHYLSKLTALLRKLEL